MVDLAVALRCIDGLVACNGATLASRNLLKSLMRPVACCIRCMAQCNGNNKAKSITYIRCIRCTPKGVLLRRGYATPGNHKEAT